MEQTASHETRRCQEEAVVNEIEAGLDDPRYPTRLVGTDATTAMDDEPSGGEAQHAEG